MKKMRIYIAGPITKGDLCDNINRANEVFLALAKAGFAPMCPHWSCFSGVAWKGTILGTEEVVSVAKANPTSLTHADWLAIDLSWLQMADALLRLPGESTGADMEEAHAKMLCMPIFRLTRAGNIESVITKMWEHLNGVEI
jgi:hypothetical protein